MQQSRASRTREQREEFVAWLNYQLGARVCEPTADSNPLNVALFFKSSNKTEIPILSRHRLIASESSVNSPSGEKEKPY